MLWFPALLTILSTAYIVLYNQLKYVIIQVMPLRSSWLWQIKVKYTSSALSNALAVSLFNLQLYWNWRCMWTVGCWPCMVSGQHFYLLTLFHIHVFLLPTCISSSSIIIVEIVDMMLNQHWFNLMGLLSIVHTNDPRQLHRFATNTKFENIRVPTILSYSKKFLNQHDKIISPALECTCEDKG